MLSHITRGLVMIAVCSAVVFAISPPTLPTSAPSIAKRADIFSRDELAATKCIFAKGAVGQLIEYCLVLGQSFSENPPLAGIYLSQDGGATWKVVSKRFKFLSLFIHPKTGELFAGIEWKEPLVEAASRRVTYGYSHRAIRSANGKEWFDVTPNGATDSLPSFSTDPGSSLIVIHGSSGHGPTEYRPIDASMRIWKEELVPLATDD